ncbi:MAG: 1,4-alpha-glucan branching protein GlgB [Clostridia bacterium]|nr:1,4-alpha-glucan branching protein GlgB [Clostridia bacterium]
MYIKDIHYIDLQPFDMYLFHEGNHFESYNFMGAHFLEHGGVKGVNFTVWAPHAREVRVVGDFNSWDGTSHRMRREKESGLWNIFIGGLGEEERYKYEIITQEGLKLLKADPYGFYSEVRPNTASVTMPLNKYKWQDEKWIEKNKKKAAYGEPINIYELHLGSWRRKENGGFYNYREIIEELIDYVVYMGYTHIELLPLTEHPFDGSWGYQTTGYYSLTSRYGKPEDFMYFVDICHQKGIGVILDWVPGHFCKDEHGLSNFDGKPLYENDNSMMAELHEWGTKSFDFSKPEVLSFLISNAMFWFDIYHIDGIRVDAVSSMLYLNFGRKEGEWIPNKYGSSENLGAIEFFRRMNKIVFEKFSHALMIAEESTAWPLVTSPAHLGGLGFNFKWNMGWMNDMLKYMETDHIYRKWHHNLITFSFTYAFSENFILVLSHDEVVHGKKSLVDKMPGDYWQKFANLRVFYAYMFAHPGKKLLFMGGEFAQFIEWNYNKELDWFLLDYEMHRKTHHYIRELNHLYRNEKSLYEVDNDYKGFSWIDHQNYEQSIIAFMRKGEDEKDFIIVICNFTSVVRHNYKVGVPIQGEYEEVFNSDLEKYGGSGVRNTGGIKANSLKWNNQPFSIEVTIPPLGAMYIKLKK